MAGRMTIWATGVRRRAVGGADARTVFGADPEGRAVVAANTTLARDFATGDPVAAALLIVVITVVARLWALPTPRSAAAQPSLASQPQCIIEPAFYMSDGLRIAAWIMKPPGEGPFPVVVWNHGSRIWFEGGRMMDRVSDPTIDTGSPCHPFVVQKGYMIFYPEGRGYYLSQGPRPTEAVRSQRDTISFLYGRAADANAGRQWLRTRPEANNACVAIGGVSHGGVTSMLASGTAPAAYVTTIAQAPGAWYGTLLGLAEMVSEGAKIAAPILIQHAANDTLVPVEISRSLARELQLRGRTVEYREYPGLPGVEGHSLFQLGYFPIWGPDVVRALDRAFAGCSR